MTDALDFTEKVVIAELVRRRLRPKGKLRLMARLPKIFA